MKWKVLTSNDQLDQIISQSFDTPQIIFKHSTSCSISSMAKMRFESNASQILSGPDYYFLDLLSYRSVSNSIAEKLNVQHESPQIIILYKGKVAFDASHFDITAEAVAEKINYLYA